ncbi:MAG: enoyl-CoA hydratase/isomerase family protein [Thermoleophilaceae bacterium]
MADPAVIAEHDGPVAVARLNRPDERNTLTQHTMEALVETLEGLDADPRVRCIVIAGNERSFAAGGDMASADRADAVDLWRRLRAPLTPVVAAVSGYALGGGWELALTCDLVVASESAEFGQPEIMLGLIPGGGATQRLTRAIGRQRAMELVLTGRRIPAAEAFALGLVNKVTHKKEWLEQSLQLARLVAKRPPIAARLAKQAVLTAEETGITTGFEEERRLYGHAMATEDRVEAMQAYREQRPPKFTGR